MTLADTTTYTRTFTKLPKNWKSALMRLAPYGTDYQGVAFTTTR